jgi:uncharacterized protein YidB (DUF937 family)
MFDQILQLVKEHIGNNPQVSSAIPGDKKEAVNHEIASHITTGLQNQAVAQGGAGGLLSMLQNAIASGSPVTSAIEGGLISSLASKFGLPPMATGAIAGALPGLLQKFAHKANDPNDTSITQESITNSLSGKLGGLGNLFNK